MDDLTGNLISFSAAEWDSFQIAESRKIIDTLKKYEIVSNQIIYSSLDYDTAAIRFTNHPGDLIKYSGNVDYKIQLHPFVFIHDSVMWFDVLYEDYDVFDTSGIFLSNSSCLVECILRSCYKLGNGYGDTFINEMYLRDWKGRIIKLRKIWVSKKMYRK